MTVSHNSYRIKSASATWTPSGASQVSLTNLVNVELSVQTPSSPIIADGSVLAQDIPSYGATCTVRVTSIDQAVLFQLTRGKGSLVLVLEKLATGTGAATGTKTLTFGNANLVNVSASAGLSGGGQATAEFECGDNGSTALYAVS